MHFKDIWNASFIATVISKGHHGIEKSNQAKLLPLRWYLKKGSFSDWMLADRRCGCRRFSFFVLLPWPEIKRCRHENPGQPFSFYFLSILSLLIAACEFPQFFDWRFLYRNHPSNIVKKGLLAIFKRARFALNCVQYQKIKVIIWDLFSQDVWIFLT